MFFFSKSYVYLYFLYILFRGCNGFATIIVLLVDLLPSGGVLPHHKTVIIFANSIYKHRTGGAPQGDS